MLSVVTLTVAFSSVAGVARADDTSVKVAIRAQDHVLNGFLKQHPQVNQLLRGTLKASEFATTVHLFRVFAGKLDHAGVVVAKPTASTPAGAAGQTNWVRGVRDLAVFNRDMAVAVTDGLHGEKAAAGREVRAANKAYRAGNKLGDRADHDLNLPKGA